MEGASEIKSENSSVNSNEQEVVELTIFFGFFKANGKAETVERLYDRFMKSWLVRISVLVLVSVVGYRMGGFSLMRIWEWLQAISN